MCRPLTILASLVLFAAAPFAQEKEAFTLAHVLGPPQALVGPGLPALQWHPDGAHYSWLRVQNGDAALVLGAVDGSEPKVVVELRAFAAAFTAASGEAAPNPGLLAALTWNADGRSLRLFHQNVLWRITLEPLGVAKLLALPEGAAAATFAADDRWAAAVKDFNVLVAKSDGTVVPVTSDGFDDLTHGVSVSREEFGIKDGLWWDPTGRRLAFYEEDLRPVEPYPYVDFGPRPAKAVRGRYPMAGRKGSIVGVGIYDSHDDSVRWLKVDRTTEEYLTNVTWRPAGDRVVVAAVNRAQNVMDLLEFDAATGERRRVLLTETDEQWVEPMAGPVFLLDGSGAFLWFSYRDGRRHLHLHAEDGTWVRQVTSGPFDVGAFRGFRPDGKGFWFESTGPDPRQRHLYQATLDGVQLAVTSGRGHHETLIARDGTHVLDQRSSLAAPPAVDLIDVRERQVVRTLHEARDPLVRFRLGQGSFFTTKAEDGQDLHGYVVRPPEADPARKYPVIQYVYAGPHSQLVQDQWLCGPSRWNFWLQYLAARGYIVFQVDGHGTDQRGIEWQQAIHRRLGTVEVQDQVRGLEHVLGATPADPARVGVTGWSYGGFMTLSLMTREGARYRAGVAGAPVTDWAYYETGFGERYMDTPEENADGYRAANPGSHLAGLKGRLLVVQGTSDDTVMWQSTIDFLSRCIQGGMTNVDYFVYPGQSHGLRGPSFAHFLRKATDFFDQHLGGGS